MTTDAAAWVRDQRNRAALLLKEARRVMGPRAARHYYYAGRLAPTLPRHFKPDDAPKAAGGCEFCAADESVPCIVCGRGYQD